MEYEKKNQLTFHFANTLPFCSPSPHAAAAVAVVAAAVAVTASQAATATVAVAVTSCRNALEYVAARFTPPLFLPPPPCNSCS